MKTKSIIIAGFGGQGVLSVGTVLATAAMLEGKNVTFLPSYGAEQRGGTANCSVIISDEEITSPIVTNPDVAIILNQPSLDRYESVVQKNGLIILNSSMIKKSVKRSDVIQFKVPANQIASILGNIKVVNTVMLGAYMAKEIVLTIRSVENAIKKVFKNMNKKIIDLNIAAFHKGLHSI